MDPVPVPAIGSQARRKSDGILGEVYAVDPPHNVLSVRWATVPGSYGHEDCTVAQFARSWELTGIQIQPPRDTHVALGLIALIVLLVFCSILVHDTRTFYFGYDPSRPAAELNPEVLNNAAVLQERFGGLAATACATGADEYIRSITEHRFHWDVTNPLEPRFNHFISSVPSPGILTLSTDKPHVSNGFGVFNPITVYCSYDTASNEVLAYSTENPAN